MKLKCLVVEDAAFIREIYRISLANQNFDIIGEAADGLKALEMIKLHRPDIVILDLVLPLKNGLDVLSESYQLSPKTHFLVVSSIDDQEIIGKAKALGALEYIVKPFTKAQLLASLGRLSQHYQEVQNG